MIPIVDDPFASPVIPHFRDFEIAIVRPTTNSADGTQEFAANLQAIFDSHPPDPVEIPNSGTFFDFATISDFERMFPFASDPSYLEIRNFMVAIYRLFHKRYLPLTLCRRNIKAPAHLVQDIWTFLDEVGLINSDIEPSTRPTLLPKLNDAWPELIHAMDNSVVTKERWEKKVKPPMTGKPILQHSRPFKYIASMDPTISQRPSGVTVSSYRGFDGWSLEDTKKLTEIKKVMDPLRPQNQAWKTNWGELSRMVGRSPEDIAHFLVEAPFYDDSAELLNSKVQEMAPPPEILLQEAFRLNPSLRIVSRAVEGADGRAADILRGNPLPAPNTPEEAAAMLAVDKIKTNIDLAEKLQKQKILKLLSATVSVLKQSIESKNNAIRSSQVESSAIQSDDDDSADERPSTTSDINE